MKKKDEREKMEREENETTTTNRLKREVSKNAKMHRQ
jgi:hypothetical protein